MSDMKDFLTKLAPAIGTAMAGPLGGVALGFLADKLGVQEKTIEAVSNTLNSQKMTPDQVAQIKAAELDFARFLKQNEIDLERINADDRKSARDMQIATRSRIPGALALVVTVGFFGILAGMMTDALQVSDKQALLLLLGSLSTAFGSVLSYYFGSSAGSQAKTQLLHQSTPIK